MVKMKNIKRIGDVISMDCYAEGKEEGHFYIEIDAVTFEIVTNTWNEMNAYVFHAFWNVKECVVEGKELPEQMMSMWC